eukprot:1969744-Amphidinium_carterae.1
MASHCISLTATNCSELHGDTRESVTNWAFGGCFRALSKSLGKPQIPTCRHATAGLRRGVTCTSPNGRISRMWVQSPRSLMEQCSTHSAMRPGMEVGHGLGTMARSPKQFGGLSP